jgi:hypothetical protein
VTIFYPGGAIEVTAGLVVVVAGVLALIVTSAVACMYLMMRGR